MKNTATSVTYFIIGIFNILLPDQPAYWPGFFSKALIIPVLMFLFLLNIKPSENRLHKYMLSGLFFSWAGDVALEFTEYDMFILGLVCFLIAHIMYSIVFYDTYGQNYLQGKRMLLIIPVIVYGLLLISFLYRDLGGMRFPVIIYTLVILTMLTGAINRKEKVNKVSFYLVLGGAILFVLSDSAIAVSKFSFQFKSSGIVVMSTYILAQYLIAIGYIKQFSNQDRDQED
jgi:uncharacterized membrane protein YhhN